MFAFHFIQILCFLRFYISGKDNKISFQTNKQKSTSIAVLVVKTHTSTVYGILAQIPHNSDNLFWNVLLLPILKMLYTNLLLFNIKNCSLIKEVTPQFCHKFQKQIWGAWHKFWLICWCHRCILGTSSSGLIYKIKKCQIWRKSPSCW